MQSECEHLWQCYAVAESYDVEPGEDGKVYRASSISHFRACPLCGVVEELKVKDEE